MLIIIHFSEDYNLKAACAKIYSLLPLFFILMPLKKCIIELHNSSVEILDTNDSGSLVIRLK